MSDWNSFKDYIAYNDLVIKVQTETHIHSQLLISNQLTRDL